MKMSWWKKLRLFLYAKYIFLFLLILGWNIILTGFMRFMHIKTGTKYHLNTLLNNYNQTEKEIPPSEVTFFTSFFFLCFQNNNSITLWATIYACVLLPEKKKSSKLSGLCCAKKSTEGFRSYTKADGVLRRRVQELHNYSPERFCAQLMSSVQNNPDWLALWKASTKSFCGTAYCLSVWRCQRKPIDSEK